MYAAEQDGTLEVRDRPVRGRPLSLELLFSCGLANRGRPAVEEGVLVSVREK